jgi:hypothetical protein
VFLQDRANIVRGQWVGLGSVIVYIVARSEDLKLDNHTDGGLLVS